MKKLLIATTIAIALIGAQVFAETDPAKEIDKRWAAIAAAQQMQKEHMTMMQATMQKIQGADDPAVRKQLMQEHMQEMRSMMDMMRGSSDGSMMGGHMMGGHAQAGGLHPDAAMPMCKDDSAQCQQMNAMGKYQEHMAQEMAMIQMMLQQLMERGATHEEKGSHQQ